MHLDHPELTGHEASDAWNPDAEDRDPQGPDTGPDPMGRDANV